MDPEKAYNLALDYVYSFVDYSLKRAAELAKADFNLDRMRDLMTRLGDPQNDYPVVHVAGTKGKGSVCALSASALRAAGYRVGLYTSPHLLDYCERIQVDGYPISHEEFVELVEQVRSVVEQVPHLTTFEITTAIGFLYFRRRKVDLAVIEVGLGGRLDATNIVRPEVAVITSLSYDHMAVLGNTLSQIAGEKAGIIKSGVPVVSAPQKMEALEVLERTANERGATLALVGRDTIFAALHHSLDGQSLIVTPSKPRLATLQLEIPLLGAHQVENAAVAYTALKTRELTIADVALQEGFASVRWPARFDVVRRKPPVILDSAHNGDSFVRLRQTLEDYFPGIPVYMIFGASEDKNVQAMLAEVKPRAKRIFMTQADHPRALPTQQLLRFAQQVSVPCEAAESVQSAFLHALELAQSDNCIVLSAGSMFVTAEVMAAWRKIQPQHM